MKKRGSQVWRRLTDITANKSILWGILFFELHAATKPMCIIFIFYKSERYLNRSMPGIFEMLLLAPFHTGRSSIHRGKCVFHRVCFWEILLRFHAREKKKIHNLEISRIAERKGFLSLSLSLSFERVDISRTASGFARACFPPWYFWW